ncbi:hypothetical protein ZWY2020_022516 [Hordeum vulgare]|nr:hypothetical protein ZWY2020_022516 [Hordeum vulgare]
MGKSASALLAAAMAAAAMVFVASSPVAAFPVAGVPGAEPSFPNPDAFDAELEAAVATYQRNFGLNATGVLDPPTVSQMVAPRCGVADVINGTSSMDRNASAAGHGRHLYTYFPGGPMWPPFRRELRYAITATAATSIDRATLSAVFARAFARWSDATTLRFAEAASEADADITIGFYAGRTATARRSTGRWARWRTPSRRRTGGSTWTRRRRGWRTGRAATRRGGGPGVGGGARDRAPAGLGHSSVQGAIMYPTIRTGTRKVDLESDDAGDTEPLRTNPNFRASRRRRRRRAAEMDSSAGASSRPGGGSLRWLWRLACCSYCHRRNVRSLCVAAGAVTITSRSPLQALCHDC